MLCQYLIQSSLYAEVVRAARSQIKPLKILRQEHLVKAFSQILTKERASQNIADFMTVNIDINFQNLPTQMASWFRNSQKLNGKTTTLVLYDFIKKRCNFDNFITLLSQNSNGSSEEIMFTQQFFLSFLLNNSDTYLRTMILMTCSNFMPLPLVSYQPKQQKIIAMQMNQLRSKSGHGKMMVAQKSDQDIAAASVTQLEFTPHVYEELFYCFEKYMAVLAFKVSANKNKSPQGCTSLTNYVFNRTFQTHSQSLVNYGSIDIQFDYNFEHPMFIPVADAHGLVEDEILERVYPIFNIFMIHFLIGHEHQEVAQKQIAKINQVTKNPLIFLIIHDESRKDNNFASLIDENIVKISLGHYNQLLGIPRSNLRTFILQKFHKYIGDCKSYEANISARLKSLQDFSKFAEEFQAFKNQLKEMNEEIEEAESLSQDHMQLKEGLNIIKNFMILIDDNKEHLRSDKVLKMNFLFEEACNLEKKLLRDTSLKKETCEEYGLRVVKLYKEMRESMPSQLTQELRKIIDLQNYLGLTSIISKFIRSFLTHYLKPLLQEREKLRTDIQKLKQDDIGKEEIFERIGEITKTVEQRYYSNEFLYREYYISELSQLKGSEKPPSQSFTDYLSLCNLQISQGQPFEIIDGNNLQFLKEVYQRIQDGGRQDEEILVVSIIGPQSSGKSLLLNTLFGAQFLSSAGRCTRGIYGCIIDIKFDVKHTRFKKILILDSEGIQSTEAIDEAFDKRVVFYILCVSHVVLICNKGEMNKNMEDTIKLATDCMMQVKQKIDQQPQVNIIMNNVQINENSLYQTIQSLSNCLLEMKRHEGQRQIFSIDESNVFLLPNAFAQSGNESFVAYQPSYQFAEKVDQLRQKILNYMQSTNDIAFFTLESWFKFAQGFWEFTDGYSGLTDYSTLEERKEDITLGEFIKQLISDHFEDPQMIQKHEKMIQEEVSAVLDQHQGFDQTNINVIKKKIDNALHPGLQEVEKKIYDEFRKFTDDKGIRPQIKKRRVEQLETQMKQHFFNWQQIVQKLLGEFNEKKSKFIGDKSLQNAIDGYIQGGNVQYGFEDAQLIFNTEWDKIIKQMKTQLKQKDQISEEQFKDIGQNLYRQNGRQIINVDKDRKLLSSYQGLQRKVIQDHLVQQKEFLYFDPKINRTSSDKFKLLIESEKHYIDNKNLEFFEENKSQRYYNWKKVVNERLILFSLSEAFKPTSEWSLKRLKVIPLYEKKIITQNYIEEVIFQIQAEAQYFDIDITDEFRAQLNQLAAINQSEDPDSKKKKNIRKCVYSIQQRIQSFFVYKKKDDLIRAPQNMKYFHWHAFHDSSTNKFNPKFSQHNYIEKLQPQDSELQKGGYQPLDEQQIYFLIKPQQDNNFYEYLKFLVRSEESLIGSRSPLIEAAVSKFYSLFDHEKILKIIQNNVLVNIFKKDQSKYETVEQLVSDLIDSHDPNITQEFCAMDFKVLQRIARSIEDIVTNINEDMEPYWLTVSEHGRDCLHQIAQTYIVRIMQEVIRLTEHAPLFTFTKQKSVQRDLFIAKLTSNDIQMDEMLAKRTASHLAQTILKDLKIEQVQEFQTKIKGEQNLFKLKTIVSNIENQIVQIADEVMPDQFEIESQPEQGLSWWERLLKMIGLGRNQVDENLEEEKKEELLTKMKNFKINEAKFEFTPEEIIMFYVQPSEFLKNKFKDQWSKVTDVEIKNARRNYADKIKQIKLNYKLYFQSFLKQIKSKKIQLSTNVFIPEGQDQPSSQEFASQIFKVNCQKAMAIYMGLVVIKEWKDGTAIQVDDHSKMIHPTNLSLVKHFDIGIDLVQPYASILKQDIQNEFISNIENFINNLMSELETHLDPEQPIQNSLQEQDLIGNLYQEMQTKTLGCDKMCPLCRRQCDQVHDIESLEDSIHCCETGHQIQGFGGNIHKADNYAITFGCHELDDSDMVVWKGAELKWKKFQTVIFNELKWNLEDKDQGAKQLIKEKNVKIWNKIGQFICDYYKLKQGIDIKFQKADANAKKKGTMQRVHYILMLDNSISMSDEDQNGQSCWENLLSAVSSFLSKFNPSLQRNSKVSIITYNDEANLDIDSQVPSQDILNALNGPGGLTDFNPPLELAQKQMEKYQNSYDWFVLVMMTDGDAKYPQAGIENIKKSPAKGKLKFKTIAYGEGSDSKNNLIRMAQELGGSSDKILEPSQLSNAFIQMIPNIYDAQ